MVVHLGVQIGLGSIYLIDRRILEYRVVFRCEWYHQTCVLFLGKFGQRLDVLLVQRPEYDVHVLHLAFAQNGVQRGTFGARIVSVQVNGSAGTFQTVYGHQQAFVVFHHTGGLTLRYPVQKGEDDGSLDGAETLCLFSVFAEQLAVGRRGLQLRALLRLCLGVGDAEEGSLLYFVLAFQLRIGGNQLGFADAVFAADAEYGFFSFHLVHVAAARLYGTGNIVVGNHCVVAQCLGWGHGFGLGCGRNEDDLSDTEILGAQSRVGVTDGFGRYVVFHGQPVEGLAGCDGVVCFFLCVGGTAGDTQHASDEYSLVTAGIQFDDVCLADAVHAGDGVETLSFFDGMQEIRLVLLCHCTQRACAGKQQGADNAVNRFHSVIVGLCLQFPKVAAKVRILWHFCQRIALRNNIVHFKTEK